MSSAQSFREECPGANNNLEVTFIFHETVNPAGTITVSFSDFDVTCPDSGIGLSTAPI